MNLLNIKGQLLALILVSVAFTASASETIRVFYNDANPVAKDIKLPDHIKVIGYNMDGLDNIKSEVTSLLYERIGTNPATISSDELTKAFSDFANSDEFPAYYKKMERGAFTIANAMRFQVKKVPAIIINDASVIYGVRSLKEALEIYGREVRK